MTLRTNLKRAPILQVAVLLTCLAQSAYGDENLPSLKERLKQLENVVTGATPKDETDEQRISAIELKLFGRQHEGTLLDRIMQAQQSAASAAATKQDDWAVTTPTSSSGSATASPEHAPAPMQIPTTASPDGLISPDSITTKPTSSVKSSETKAGASQNAVTSIDAAGPSRTPPDDSPVDDGWPTSLPRLDTSTNHGPFKIEVSESASVQKIVDEYKKRSDADVFSAAQNYFQNNNYAVAEKLDLLLTERHPKFARYFYEAGEAEAAQDRVDDAFANYALAWHLGHADAYTRVAEKLVPILQRQIDPDFKLTYQWQAGDPESVLNAGTRLWKGGCTTQAIRVFEWALKNEAICRGAAAYNLGAIAESQGNLKTALRYYQWAAAENARLQAESDSHPALSAAIGKSLGIFPNGYIEKAITDVQHKLLRGDVGWHGWTQPRSYPEKWGSEVCPLCAISRTSATYEWGQNELR